MVNYIILYKKFVEHHVIKFILLKISKLSAHLTQAIVKWAESLDIFNKINLITWCSTNFLYKIFLKKFPKFHVWTIVHNLPYLSSTYPLVLLESSR